MQIGDLVKFVGDTGVTRKIRTGIVLNIEKVQDSRGFDLIAEIMWAGGHGQACITQMRADIFEKANNA